MSIFYVSIIETLLLVTALSVDSFVASFAYGANKIKIPLLSVSVISIICSIILVISVFFGFIIKPLIPENMTKTISFIILFLLGIIKLFDSSIKTFIRKHNDLNKQLKFSLFNLSFILNIYADPQNADSDLSRELSPKEAAPLAVALSIDGLAVGVGAGLVTISLIQIMIFSLLTNIITILLGSYIGYKIAERTSLNLSWLSGVLLIVLAVMKL